MNYRKITHLNIKHECQYEEKNVGIFSLISNSTCQLFIPLVCLVFGKVTRGQYFGDGMGKIFTYRKKYFVNTMNLTWQLPCLINSKIYLIQCKTICSPNGQAGTYENCQTTTKKIIYFQS